MTTDLTKKTEDSMSFGEMQSMAVVLLKSGFLPSAIRTPEQALAIMLTGKELGLGLMESLRSINVIQGKPTMSAQLLLGLCYRTGHVEKAAVIEESPTACTFILQRKGCPEYKSTFTLEDAKRLGYANKDNWIKQPATMLKWRAISAACRVVFPDAISGVYEITEMQDAIPIEPPNEDVPSLSNKDKEAQPKGDEIPDDEIGNWVFPKGKYAGKRLIEVYSEVTESGRQKGLEYLLWCAENLTTESWKKNIQRFLTVMEGTKEVDINA